MMSETVPVQFYHAHRILHERCRGTMRCMRICPTRAIRVRNGRVSYLQDLCIDCGECLKICPHNTFVSINDDIADFSSVKYKVAMVSPVLYTQFGPEVHPYTIHKALINIGFHEIVDATGICNEISFALLHHIKNNPDKLPVISSICPCVLRFVQVRYPNLVPLVSTFDVPREILAREIKETYPQKLGLKEEEISVIYITSCPAKVVSIHQPAEKERSWLDGAIPIRDIYNLILPEIMEIQRRGETIQDEHFYYGTGWVVMGHITRDVGAERWLSVSGIDHVKKIFDDIENSKLKNVDFVEALACRQGCVGGVFCVENPYVARSTSIRLETKYGKSREIDEDEVLEKYHGGHYFIENPVLPRPTRTFQADISTSIKRMRQKERVLLKLPGKDCGLCGSPTCETFAEDCARGEVEITDCIFYSNQIKL